MPHAGSVRRFVKHKVRLPTTTQWSPMRVPVLSKTTVLTRASCSSVPQDHGCQATGSVLHQCHNATVLGIIHRGGGCHPGSLRPVRRSTEDAAPCCTSTGRLSPVMADSSNDADDDNSRPSTGTTSEGRTKPADNRCDGQQVNAPAPVHHVADHACSPRDGGAASKNTRQQLCAASLSHGHFPVHMGAPMFMNLLWEEVQGSVPVEVFVF